MTVVRKVQSTDAWDVPTAIVVPVVALLAALFVPFASRQATYPTDLPPLTYDPAAVERTERQDRAPRTVHAAPEILASWSVLTAALASQDDARIATAQDRFAEVLAQGTQRDPAALHSIRLLARRRFLQDVTVPTLPLAVIARRHGLAGDRTPAYVDRAVQIAWVDFMFERLALVTPEHGALEPVTDTLQRIPAPERRALVAWGLAARCAEVVGHPDYPRPGDPRRCARLRQESITGARSLDPNYPTVEALAAVDVMEALGNQVVAGSTDDATTRAAALAEAQAALVQGQYRYSSLLQSHRSRRLEGYLMGVVAELGATEP